VYQDLGDARDLLFNRGLNLCGHLVSLAHREVGRNVDMKVNPNAARAAAAAHRMAVNNALHATANSDDLVDVD
jgi:hypothetical protein